MKTKVFKIDGINLKPVYILAEDFDAALAKARLFDKNYSGGCVHVEYSEETPRKYTKIRGVDKDICSAEQKIAYNIAWRIMLNSRDDYKALATFAERAEMRSRLIIKGMCEFVLGYGDDFSAERLTAIHASLASGLKRYIDGSTVLGSYEEIGDTFPKA